MTAENQGLKPKIIVFACHWCTYAAGELASLNQLAYPAELRVEKVKCSGKIDPLYVRQSFANGAAGIMVAGCNGQDCPYGSEFEYDQKKHQALHSYLESMGIEKGRFQAYWPLGMEGPPFKEAFDRLNQAIKRLGFIKSNP